MPWSDVRENQIDLSGKLYFCYGSNIFKEQMKQRCRYSKPVCLGVLKDYKLMFRTVADIQKHKGKTVQGALYTVTEDDIQMLNRYEGYPFKYDIKTGTVDCYDGTQKQVFWYEIKRKGITLSPAAEYLSRIIIGYHQWNIRPDSLYDALRRVENAKRNRGKDIIHDIYKQLAKEH